VARWKKKLAAKKLTAIALQRYPKESVLEFWLYSTDMKYNPSVATVRHTAHRRNAQRQRYGRRKMSNKYETRLSQR